MDGQQMITTGLDCGSAERINDVLATYKGHDKPCISVHIISKAFLAICRHESVIYMLSNSTVIQ